MNQEWQPIESAPKDGPILLWDGFDVSKGYWTHTALGWHAEALCFEDPTHWMPLPAPPVIPPERP